MKNLAELDLLSRSEEVAPLDAGFWYLDTPTTPQTIASFGVIEGVPDRALLWEHFERLLPLFPRLTQRITDNGRLFWTRDLDFRLDHHLQFVDPLDHETPEQSLSRLFSLPLAKERPPWEFIVLSSGFFLFKLHHTLADGMGGLALLDALFNGANAPKTRRTLPDSPPLAENLPTEAEGSPTPLSTARSHRTFSRVWMLLRSFLLSRPPFSWRVFLSSLSKRPLFKGRNSPQRSLIFFDLPLLKLRSLKHSLGVSLNDLFLLLCCRAVQRVCSQDNSVHLGKKPPHPIQVIMPVSTRPLSERHGLGNQLLAVNLPLPLHCESLLDHLMAIRSITHSYKQGEALESFECLAFVGSYLPRWLQRPVGELFLRSTSFICTNMPLPRVRRSLAGAPIVSQYGVPALLRTHGVGFSLMTYTDRACFSIVTDPKIVSEPERLREEIEEVFELLSSLALALPQQKSGEKDPLQPHRNGALKFGSWQK